MSSNQTQRLLTSNPTDRVFADYIPLFIDLLSFGQTRRKDTANLGQLLCQEIRRLTQGRAWLVLPAQDLSQRVPSSTSINFPIRFHHRTYGTLYIASDPQQPGSPALPLPVAHLLAHICSSLLYTLEVSVFIEGQSRRIEERIYGDLTSREQEVLLLICRGHPLEEISSMLHITLATVETYQKSLCQKLGVHCKQDLPLAAYKANLFSILAYEGRQTPEKHAKESSKNKYSKMGKV